MCGIAGYVGARFIPEENVAGALRTMACRGPDHAGTFRSSSGDFHAVLLHSRLAIIDLDPRSHQPFGETDLRLVFNGEIYNYLEVGESLGNTVRLRTKSDTEILYEAYRARGSACLEQLEGMWALGFLDTTRSTLFLSRDRFGEKPLFIHRAPDGFYFASEIKTLAALRGAPFSPNYRHLLRYLVNGYKSLFKTRETWFEDVEEVGPGEFLRVGRDLSIERARYWRPGTRENEMSLEEAIAGVRARLIESVRMRLRADVPLAFCLSGGVDSAALASIAAKEFGYDVMSFSILDEDPRYNELDNIRATIDDIRCRHAIITPPKADFLDRMAELVRYHDGPVATISYYVHSFLSESIAGNGFRVAISGTAADELFTGYYDHHNLFLHEMRHRPEYEARLREWSEHIAPIVRNPFLQDPELYEKKPGCREHIYLNRDVFAGMLRVPFEEKFHEEHYAESPLRNRMLNELFHEAIPVILREDDLNSMRYSIENRSPYLDTSLFDFAFSIPVRHLIRDGYGKFVLREAVKGILNDRVRLDRQKKGFNASLRSVLDLDQPDVSGYLLDAKAPVFELVDRGKVAAVLGMNPLPNSYSKFLFNFINVKIFLEQRKS